MIDNLFFLNKISFICLFAGNNTEFTELYLLFLHFIQYSTICYGLLKKELPYLVYAIDFLPVK